MITPDYVVTMATYNAEMNRRLYEAAARLPDAERRRDRGAFWKSIFGTFNHLLWADHMWMSRFDGWEKPAVVLAASAELYRSFEQLCVERRRADERMAAWARSLDPVWLAGTCAWYSGAAQRSVEAPRSMLLVHLFNHQTHHRGQAHALLTAAGERTGDTDIWLVLPPAVA